MSKAPGLVTLHSQAARLLATEVLLAEFTDRSRRVTALTC
jgi:hypothetical protein